MRHKGKSFIIDEIDTKHLKLSNIKDEPMDTLESGVADQELANKENEHSHNGMFYYCLHTHLHVSALKIDS